MDKNTTNIRTFSILLEWKYQSNRFFLRRRIRNVSLRSNSPPRRTYNVPCFISYYDGEEMVDTVHHLMALSICFHVNSVNHYKEWGCGGSTHWNLYWYIHLRVNYKFRRRINVNYTATTSPSCRRILNGGQRWISVRFVAHRNINTMRCVSFRTLFREFFSRW